MRNQNEKNKSYYAENREAELSRNKSWAKANPVRRAFSNVKSRAKKRDLSFSLLVEDFTMMFDSKCHYCGSEDTTGFDRVDPTIGYERDNVVPCCPTCNYGKHKQTTEEFLAWVKRVHDYNIDRINASEQLASND